MVRKNFSLVLNILEYLHSSLDGKKNLEKSHNFSRERGAICTQTVILSVVSLWITL